MARVRREADEQHAPKVLGNASLWPGWAQLAALGSLKLVHERSPFEWPLAIEPLVERDEEAELVGDRPEIVLKRLRGDVSRRAQKRAGLSASSLWPIAPRGRWRCVAGPRLGSFVRQRLRAGQAEVRHPDSAVLVDEHIVRFEVAVNEPRAMSRGEPFPRCAELRQRLSPIARLVEPSAECAAAHVLH